MNLRNTYRDWQEAVRAIVTQLLAFETANTTAIDLKANIASPTFTGPVTIPTPFTLGAVSVLPTGTELNYVDGVTSSIQTQLDGKQPLDATLTAIANDSLGAFSHRNKLYNPGFAVNQRGYVSGAAVGAGLYGHDRWKMAASGDTYTFSTTANKTTVTIPASKVLQQVVEGLSLQSGTYTLSWEGTAQGKIGAGSLSASGVTGSITGGTNTTIEFGPGTVANVQLEFGSVTTPFENRPYGTELALCQRYYETVSNSLFYTYADGVGGYKISVPFKVTKRAAPTITYTLSGGATASTSIAIDGVIFYAVSAANIALTSLSSESEL